MELVVSEPPARQALSGLLRAEAAVRRRLAADLAREGVSPTQFALLELLVSAGGTGLLRRLREDLRLSKAAATEAVDGLQARGLVTRERVEADRRAVALALTDLGAELVDRLHPEHAARVEEAFACLDAAEQQQLAELCSRLAA